MSSSIFNSDAIAWVRELSLRQRRWIVLVLLCGIAALFGTALAMRDYVKPDNEQTRALATITPRTKVAFLGSSHVLAGVDAASMRTPAVNLSGPAHDPTCMSAVFAGNQRRLSALKIAVIELDPYFLQVNSVEHFGGDYRRIFDLDADVSRLNVDAVTRLRVGYAHWWYRSIFWPLVAYQKPSPRRLVWADDEATPQPGFVPRGNHENLAIHAEARVKEHRGQADPENIARNREALATLIRDAKSAGARVVLVRMPIHPSYRSRMPESWSELLDETVARLRKQLGDNAFEWWNLNELLAFDDADFSDSDHLHATGAAKLTRYLDRRLQDLLQETEDAPD